MIIQARRASEWFVRATAYACHRSKTLRQESRAVEPLARASGLYSQRDPAIATRLSRRTCNTIRHSLHAEILVSLLSFLVFMIGWLLWSRESIASDCCNLRLVCHDDNTSPTRKRVVRPRNGVCLPQKQDFEAGITRSRTTRSRVGLVFSTQPGDRYSTFTSYM